MDAIITMRTVDEMRKHLVRAVVYTSRVREDPDMGTASTCVPLDRADASTSSMVVLVEELFHN